MGAKIAKKPGLTFKPSLTWTHIENLKLRCMVGIRNWEKHIPQNLYLSLSFGYARRMPHNDEISNVVDYAQVAQSVENYCAQHHFHLLENWMDGMAQHIYSHFPQCRELRLKLSKSVALDNAEGVALSCVYQAQSAKPSS